MLGKPWLIHCVAPYPNALRSMGWRVAFVAQCGGIVVHDLELGRMVGGYSDALPANPIHTMKQQGRALRASLAKQGASSGVALCPGCLRVLRAERGRPSVRPDTKPA